MRLAPTYLARGFVAWPGGIAAAVRMLTWIPLWPAAGCGTPLIGRPSMASCQMAASFLVRPDVHGAEPRGCLVADFHLVSFPPALILLPRASRPPCIWPLALDCLGRESSGSNSPSVPRLPCSHAEILHCRACADTAFCPPGRLLACFRDLLQRPQVSPNILYGSRIPSRHAELLGAVSAEISSHLGRTGWTSSWTHQADSGCSSPGIIPESYLLELADHHPQRGRPPHGVKGARPPLNPRSLALMLCLPLDPASDLTFPCHLRCRWWPPRLLWHSLASFWPALAEAVPPAAPPPPPPRLRGLVFECVDWPSGQLPTVPRPCIGGLRGWGGYSPAG